MGLGAIENTRVQLSWGLAALTLQRGCCVTFSLVKQFHIATETKEAKNEMVLSHISL